MPPAARAAAVAVVLAALAAGTSGYLAVWRDDETLFRHALAVTRDNYVAHGNAGLRPLEPGAAQEALPEIYAAHRLDPDNEALRWFLERYRDIYPVSLLPPRRPSRSITAA